MAVPSTIDGASPVRLERPALRLAVNDNATGSLVRLKIGTDRAGLGIVAFNGANLYTTNPNTAHENRTIWLGIVRSGTPLLSRVFVLK